VQEIAFSNLKKILADKQRVEEGVKEAHRHFNEIAKRNNVERPKLMRELTDTKVGIERAARTIITVGDSPTMSKILQELEVK
jgi:hypothetical protein